ncbi:hypothetical protein AUJ17_05705 [Candidatus Micrarchaeota archaeon CG1_02_47_40]|nr:MAG: hypothetical protein AUJ17_05705 [Candidatus Micrarchaeota archaeon CG1_02_47_40]
MLKEIALGRKMSECAGEFFARFPLSPNQWTLLSVLLALGGFFALLGRNVTFAAAFFLLSFFCDLVDGAVARKRGEKTKFGAYLDGMCDRYVEFLLLFGMLFYPLPAFLLPTYAWLFLILFFGTCMTAFAKAYASHRGAMEREKVDAMSSVFQRSERGFVLFLALVMLAFDAQFAVYLLVLAAVLSAIAVAQIILKVKRENAEKD